MNNIIKTTNTIKEMVEKLKSELTNMIGDLPENEQITDIPNEQGVKCFTIKFSSLVGSRNWSPKYFCFKNQYETIIKEIQKTNIDNIYPKLLKITEERRFVTSDKETIHLHDTVVKNVVEVLNLPKPNWLIKEEKRKS